LERERGREKRDLGRERKGRYRERYLGRQRERKTERKIFGKREGEGDTEIGKRLVRGRLIIIS